MADAVADPKTVAESNADVIEKQAAQDISGQPSSGPDNLDGMTSLDTLREKQIEEAKKLVVPAGDPIVTDPAAPPAPDPDPNKPITAPDPAIPGQPPVPVPVPVPVPDPAIAEAAAKKVAEDAAVERIFKDSPALPPNASVKSSEAFSTVKLTAAREISQLESAKSELEKKLAEAEAKANAPIPPELEQELKSLREFRAKLDVDADPKFKEFDKEVEAANEFIYSQLKKSPIITDEVIADIKKNGGPIGVNMEKILAAVNDPLVRRLVESKLGDVEMVRYKKEQAILATKSNVSEYLKGRETEWKNAASAHNSTTKQSLEALAAKIEWLNPKTIDPKLDANAKKAIEDHNTYATQMRKELDLAISDDSPEMRATLLVGMVQLFRLQASHEHATKRADAAEAELQKATDTIAKLKGASTSRLRESVAPITPSSAPKKGPDYNESAAAAMDRMRQERLKAQQAAA